MPYLLWWIYPNLIFRLTIRDLRDISITLGETNESLNKKLKLKIEKGRMQIRGLIVLQSYDKVLLSNAQVSIEKVEIEGRKIPLKSIRKYCSKNKKNKWNCRKILNMSYCNMIMWLTVLKILMNLQKNTFFYNRSFVTKFKEIERKRHIMVRHDCSTISSHSYDMIMVSIMHNPVVYLTNN